jgi:hypothetical protein
MAIPVRISSRRFKRSRNLQQRHRNLKYVNVIGPEPSKPQQIPQCLVLNARSIVKPDAFPALYADIKSNNIDVCCISETWLNHSVCNSLICPAGYSFLRKDRTNRCGGGVAMICRNDWKMESLANRTNDFECLWGKITTVNSIFSPSRRREAPCEGTNSARLIIPGYQKT